MKNEWAELLRMLESRHLTERDLVVRLGGSVPHQSLAPEELIAIVWSLGLTDAEALELWAARPLDAVESATAAHRFANVPEITEAAREMLVSLLRRHGRMPPALQAATVFDLRRLRDSLGLSAEELAETLGTTVADVGAWLEGRASVPFVTAVRIRDSIEALDRLESVIAPERLADVVRRPADLFGGNSALNLIVNGRIHEVAEKYDRLLAYVP